VDKTSYDRDEEGKLMTEGKQLTRAQACVELWGRQQLGKQDYLSPDEPVPDYFTDRAAAAGLARWIKGQNIDTRESFQQYFAELVSGGADTRSVRFFDALLATPEQIALAACRTFKIKVE
jgi:hypothetical protein